MEENKEMEENRENKKTSELQAQETVQVSYKEKKEESSLASALDMLSRFGGFNFLESTIDGTQNLNPERKARKRIFLTDEQKQGEREVLKNKIGMWIELLNSSSAVTEMIATSKAKSEAAASHLAKSQLVAVQSVRDMEQAYRGVMLFYKNTESDKVNNVTIVNASKEQLTDLDNPRFIDFVARELKQNYDKLDLRQNYSLLAIPGYLGSNKVLEKWAKIAYDNKVMLFTDFADLDKPEDVVELFFTSDMASGDAYKSNTCMVCNWLVGRAGYREIDEEEDRPEAERTEKQRLLNFTVRNRLSPILLGLLIHSVLTATIRRIIAAFAAEVSQLRDEVISLEDETGIL